MPSTLVDFAGRDGCRLNIGGDANAIDPVMLLCVRDTTHIFACGHL
jgi:hypothetical protein